MKKKVFRCLVIVLVLAAMLCTSAFAAGGHNCGRRDNNRYSYSVCSYGQMKKLDGGKEFRQLEAMVEKANATIEKLVKRAQKTPYDDVSWLLAEVDEVVADVMEYARRIGATVLCEYTEYYIDGQYVLIDPLRVINF